LLSVTELSLKPAILARYERNTDPHLPQWALEGRTRNSRQHPPFRCPREFPDTCVAGNFSATVGTGRADAEL